MFGALLKCFFAFNNVMFVALLKCFFAENSKSIQF